jgi:hypothetical protein
MKWNTEIAAHISSVPLAISEKRRGTRNETGRGLQNLTWWLNSIPRLHSSKNEKPFVVRAGVFCRLKIRKRSPSKRAPTRPV